MPGPVLEKGRAGAGADKDHPVSARRVGNGNSGMLT